MPPRDHDSRCRTSPRGLLLLGVLGACLLTGCLDDLVRSYIPVTPLDGEPAGADAGPGADGVLPAVLALSEVKPGHGPFVGGTEVTLYGAAFTPDTAVHIGGKAIQTGETEVLSPVAIKVITPAGSVGPADVTVSRGGESAALPGGFRYDPIVIDPDSGPISGGTLVTIQGKETAFDAAMAIGLGGAPLEEVEVVSPTLLRGRTPAGAAGPADLTFASPAGEQTIAGAFTYYASANPKSGGMGGGPLQGTLTVAVLNTLDRSPVPSAKVIVQQERELTLSGTTDSAGLAVFTDGALQGPVTVTAALFGFEASTLVSFDARDVTIFLMPIPKPQPGPLPPGTLAGVIKGHVLFGGSTGVGSSQWKIVPEPKVGQEKRVYVYTTAPSVEWGPQVAGPDATISYKDSGMTAWPYLIVGRSGNMAVYALAGIYTTLSGAFEAYALGITRGVVVGPGEVVTADVWITHPLTEKVTVELANVPPETLRYRLRLALSLGADGLILRPDHELKGEGLLQSAPFARLPRLAVQGLVDAAYTVDVLLEVPTPAGLPMARGTLREVQPASGVLRLDGFVGVPRAEKPQPGGPLAGNTLMWSQTGAPASLAVTMLRLPDETPIWRVISRGEVSLVKLPDPATFGLPGWPAGPLIWLQWLAHLPGYDFDTFNYSHLSSSYWDRWSYDEFPLVVP